VLFPGAEVSSGFYDGVVGAYSPSLPEILLGIGGVAMALAIGCDQNGSTETSVFVCVQPDGQVKADTVGPAVKGVELSFTPERELRVLPSFYLYVDEFQSFANESFADILSEARKYKLNLTIAHQYIEQMSDEVRAAVFGNVGTMVTFRVGAYDAEVLEKEFAPQFTAEDLVNLGVYQIYLKLMIDNVSSQPFSATQ